MASRRHLQISLDEEYYSRLAEVAERRGSPIEVVVLEAIDRLVQEQTRQAAGARLLAAEPMPVGDWKTLKKELSEATVGRPWHERD
jgi:hypothetical protein